MQRGERARASALLKEPQKAIESMLGEGIDTPLAFEELAAIEAILGNTQVAVAAYQRAYNAGWRCVNADFPEPGCSTRFEPIPAFRHSCRE